MKALSWSVQQISSRDSQIGVENMNYFIVNHGPLIGFVPYGPRGGRGASQQSLKGKLYAVFSFVAVSFVTVVLTRWASKYSADTKKILVSGKMPNSHVSNKDIGFDCMKVRLS